MKPRQPLIILASSHSKDGVLCLEAAPEHLQHGCGRSAGLLRGWSLPGGRRVEQCLSQINAALPVSARAENLMGIRMHISWRMAHVHSPSLMTHGSATGGPMQHASTSPS